MPPVPTDEQIRVVRAIADSQSGVVSRAELVGLGLPRGYGSDRVASDGWRVILPGVYLTHPGRIEDRHRAWAAVLHCGPGSALSRWTAAGLLGLDRRPPPGERVSVVVPHTRRVTGPPWLAISRQRRPIAWSGQPARTTAEVTVLDLCEETDDLDEVVGLVTAAARLQHGTHHLRRELARRRTVRHRGPLDDLLGATGVESALEHRYLRDVVVAHDLPRPVLQRADRVEGRRIRSDAVVEEYGLRVELDGRIHETTVDDDVWRDGWVAADSGHLTLRLRWRHVLGRPCRSAALVTRGLHRGGWRGSPRTCRPGCQVLATR